MFNALSPPQNQLYVRLLSERAFTFGHGAAILDFYHAAEHLEQVLAALRLKKGTKKYKEKFRYYCKRIKAGKIESVIKSAEDACPKSKCNSLRGQAPRKANFAGG